MRPSCALVLDSFFVCVDPGRHDLGFSFSFSAGAFGNLAAAVATVLT